jgi:hypothetical protein
MTPQEMIYLYSTTGLIIIVLLYIAYNTFRTKRMIKKQIEQENAQQYQTNYQGY